MREIVPFEIYKSLSCQIADPRELDDALIGVMWALRHNAEDFPLMPGYKTLRMVKTDAVRNIPALHVIFKINPQDQVQLRYIEIAKTDEFQGPPIL